MSHATGTSTVTVGAGTRHELPAMLDQDFAGHRVAVIADTSVLDAVDLPIRGATTLTFPAGEASKTRETWAGLTDQLLGERFDRRTVVVAIGGGVGTDIAGFVAATFLRGVPWIAVPTTTLGMLDAAVGGKTGVNTDAGKNLVGAFHPPRAVVCDPELLATLPDHQYRDGLAEAVKHAATLDAAYGDWMTAHADAILARDTGALEQLVTRSVELKAAVVSSDEREGDRRAVLNAGHTVAHGLERASRFTMPHGQAVAIGLVVETRVGEAMGVAQAGTAARIAALLRAVQLPDTPPSHLDVPVIVDAMHGDKKNRDGAVHAALIASFGRMHRSGDQWTTPINLELVARSLRESG